MGIFDDGAVFALVGINDMVRSKVALEKQGVTETVEEVLADELGIDCASIFTIEQPGSFHLDMGMLMLGGRHIAVNDSRQCLTLCKGWYGKQDLDESTTNYLDWVQSVCEDRQYLEDAAASELIGQGFVVHRVAGRFDFATSPGQAYAYRRFLPPANYFNGEWIGARVWMTFAGTDKQNRHIASVFLEHLGIDRVYFVPDKWNRLNCQGGLGCLMKRLNFRPLGST